mmetsp:Transcript_23990/g.60480  ORF Transcript_23990/g.60480 Transcript_23990/m.60480 type:complete len:100 (+) Transcript_23990:163-462(+)
MAARAPSSTIREWIDRKQMHEVDPMLLSDVDEAQLDVDPANEDSERAGAAANKSQNFAVFVGKQLLCESTRSRCASGRRYFPVADCERRHFQPSGKRWR